MKPNRLLPLVVAALLIVALALGVATPPRASQAADPPPTSQPAADGAKPPAQANQPAVVDVETSDHQTAHGELLDVSPEVVALRVGADTRRYSTKSLLGVSFAAAPRPPARSAVAVELVDGSYLAAAEILVHGAQATVTLVGGAQVKAPTAALRSVRFVSGGESVEVADKQWNEILGGKLAADLLVVRKKGSLDYLEGVLQDLGSDDLKFLVDKEVVEVKRRKIEGLVYYHPAGAKPAAPVCEVAVAGGTMLAAGALKLADGELRVTTPAGAEASLPLSQTRQLDFSAGKVRFLGDLEPDRVEYSSYFSTRQPLESWNDYFQPRRNRGPQPGPLRVGGKCYTRGLSLHSRTLVAYRLPGSFSRFEAIVGMDESAGEEGAARLVVRGDGKTLWERDVRSGGQPQAIDLAIGGVKRLEIFVDFGQDLDIGDFVDLCDAKVSK